jgi:hypothetical protein
VKKYRRKVEEPGEKKSMNILTEDN